MTSRKIRREAGSIFYAENMFEFHAVDYDPIPFCFATFKLDLVYEQMGVWPTQMRFLGMQRPNWKNLITWLHHHHEDVAVFAPGTDSDDAESQVVETMFLTVHAMRDHPWHEIESLLSEHRKILGFLDERWKD